MKTRNKVTATILQLTIIAGCAPQETSLAADARPVSARPEATVAPVCIRGVDYPELRVTQAPPEPSADGSSNDSVPRVFPWGDHVYVSYGAPRAIDDFLRRTGVAVLVRAGFHSGAALYVAPDEIRNPEFLHLLDENRCVIQTYQQASCTLELRPAIRVHVSDLEGRPVESVVRSTLTGNGNVIRRSFDPATELAGDRTVTLAHEDSARAGSYDVVLEADGYATWSVGNIIVREGHCHVETVLLRGRMQRLR